MIPFNDYVPFKKAEKKIINLIENIEHTEEQLDDAIVYSALQLAIENEKLAAMKELNNTVVDLSLNIAEKLLSKELDNKEKQQENIQEILENTKLN